jgi:Tol biopolymer transport system component
MTRIPLRATAALAALLAASVACKAAPGDARAAVNTASSAAQRRISTRRVWSEGAAVMGDLTPDHRLLSFVDWSTGDLAVLDLVSGEKRRLTNKGGWETSSDFALGSAFSPDGDRLAYTWYDEEAQSFELRIRNLTSGSEQVLHAGDGYIQPYDWTPDGVSILAHIWVGPPDPTLGGGEGGSHRMTLLSLSGASRVIAETSVLSADAAMSPDGRWIAYDLPQAASLSGPLDILVQDLEGKRSRRVIEGPSNDRLLGWLKAPDALLVLSDRSGSPAVWLQPMSDGRPSGELELLREDVGQIEPIGVGADALAYFVLLEPERVVTARVDLDAAAVVAPPEPVAQTSIRSDSPAWSPDGGYLAFLLRPELIDRSGTLVLRGPDGRQVRELALPLDDVGNLRWTHDPNGLIATGTDRAGHAGVHWIDLATGGTRLLVANSGYGLRHAQLSPDDRTLYFMRDAKGGSGVYAVDLSTGIERAVHEQPVGGLATMELSPDGSRIAFTAYDERSRTYRILLVPTAGGEPVDLLQERSPTPFPGYGSMAWSPDAKHLLYTREGLPSATNQRNELWVIGADGSRPRRLLDDSRLGSMRLHPDGHRLAFASGTSRGEVWIMEGFSPAGAASVDGDSSTGTPPGH